MAEIRARRQANPALLRQHEEFDRNYDLAMQLHRLRRRCRKTQAEIAVLIGVTQSTVARIESGRALRLDTIYRYAAACGCADIRLRLQNPRNGLELGFRRPHSAARPESPQVAR